MGGLPALEYVGGLRGGVEGDEDWRPSVAEVLQEVEPVGDADGAVAASQKVPGTPGRGATGHEGGVAVEEDVTETTQGVC